MSASHPIEPIGISEGELHFRLMDGTRAGPRYGRAMPVEMAAKGMLP
jgi:hypothetical protein